MAISLIILITRKMIQKNKIQIQVQARVQVVRQITIANQKVKTKAATKIIKTTTAAKIIKTTIVKIIKIIKIIKIVEINLVHLKQTVEDIDNRKESIV